MHFTENRVAQYFIDAVLEIQTRASLCMVKVKVRMSRSLVNT